MVAMVDKNTVLDSEPILHVFRASRFHKERRYWLDGDALYWSRPASDESRRAPLQRCDESFRRLVFTLIRGLQERNPAIVLTQGVSQIEWISSVVIAMLAIAIVLVGVVLMLLHQTVAWAALAFMGAVLVYLPMLWSVIRHGRPKPLQVDNICP